jgi:hypothetical protein
MFVWILIEGKVVNIITFCLKLFPKKPETLAAVRSLRSLDDDDVPITAGPRS